MVKRAKKAQWKQWVTYGIRIAFMGLFLFLVLQGRMPVWLGIFAASLVGASFFGRVFCGYACPMNTVMGPVDWLMKKLRLPRRKAPAWMTGRILPWVMLVLSFGSMLGLKRVIGLDVPILPMLVGLAAALTLVFEPEVFHNRICPFGAIQRIGGKRTRLGKRVDAQACVGCGVCLKACDSGAIRMEQKNAVIDPASCHQCQSCTVVCPKQAISYGRL